MHPELNPKRALIFRITHRDNLPWLIRNGLHCANSDETDPAFVSIGNTDLIAKRRTREIPEPPGGTLSDYVPFYFTPFSPMFYNIHTGYHGIRQRGNEEIAIIVSSIPRLSKEEIPFLFTDRHAYLIAAKYSSNPEHLGRIDWPILQRRDFSRDNNDLGKVERYEAEALVYKCLPSHGIMGIACYTDSETARANRLLSAEGLAVKAVTKRDWYF